MASGDFVILNSGGDPDSNKNASGVEERLAAEGWERRHSVSVDRLDESVELYRSLGFEILTRKLTPADYDPACRDCATNACASHVLIYTRKGHESHDPGRPGPPAGDES